MKCQKLECLKQVNKDVPNVYFGKPFEFDDHWLACHLCMNLCMEDKPKLLKRRRDTNELD